jgi:hypothetical protein
MPKKLFVAIILLIAVVVSYGIIYYRNKCTWPIDVQYGFIGKNNPIMIDVDGAVKRKEFSYNYQPEMNKGYFLKGFCGSKDVISIKVKTGSRDTLFFVDCKQVTKVYIGYGFRHTYFDIKYVYRDSRRTPDIIEFEDW